MVICYICRNILRDRGGIETYTLEMARELSQRGHSVHIICENKGSLLREGFGGGVTIHPVDFSEHPFVGYWMLSRIVQLEDFRFSVAAAKKIKDLSRLVKIDIVEATDYFRVGFWYSFHRKVPFILRLHGWFFNRQDGRINPLGSLDFRDKLLWRMQQIAIKNADAISAVSSDFLNFASEIWKINNKICRVISNAVDIFKFSPDEKISKEAIILYVGRLIKIKGILTFADAIPQIHNSCPEVRFVFAGKDMFLKEVGCMARDYILKKVPAAQLVFLGEVAPNELVAYYRKSSVVVFPSIYDACPIACLEAMACGCSVVASDVGGFKDMIANEEQGLLVPEGRPQELAGAVIRFFRDSKLRETCAENAVRKVVEEFNYDILIEKTLSFYKEAIAYYQASIQRTSDHA